jgi:hypothetical protein
MPAFGTPRTISADETWTAADDRKVHDVSGSVTISLPTGADAGSGTGYTVASGGSVTFAASGGSTVQNASGDLVQGTAWATCVIRCKGSNVWVVHGTEVVPQFHVRNFGAKGDGSTDDTAAIQACINAAGNNQAAGTAGTDIHFGPGEFRITSELTLNRANIRFVGAGVGNAPTYASAPGFATVIRYDGTDGAAPMFFAENCHRLTFDDIRFRGSASKKPTYAVEFDNTAFGHGQNSYSEFNRCHFGRYTWETPSLNVGDLASAIGWTGANTHGDRIRVHNCNFNYCDTGLHIPNTQSIWSSIADCVFEYCGKGISTASTINGYNLAFGQCELDLEVLDTASVFIWGIGSEFSEQFASIAPSAHLWVRGGVIQCGTIQSNSQKLVDMYPSGQSSVVFEDIRFDGMTNAAQCKIEVGGESASTNVGNWVIRVQDCEGIIPTQVAIQAGAFWATSPVSRGYVEWRSIHSNTNYYFRNHLATGYRTGLSSNEFDPAPLTRNVKLGIFAGASLTTGENNALFGYNAGNAMTTKGNATGMGYNSNPNGDNSVAVGFNASAAADNTTAIGASTTATNASVVIGTGASASGLAATAIGPYSASTHFDSVALGYNTATTATAQVKAGARHVELTEITDPAAGATNSARLYSRDNGSGKTQLVVRFPTGAIQVLATEP